MRTHYPADWPQGLIDIAEVIGPEPALLLARHVGGVTRVDVHQGVWEIRELSWRVLQSVVVWEVR